MNAAADMTAGDARIKADMQRAARRTQLLTDLAAAIRAVPLGRGTDETGAEVYRCLESAVNEGAIPDVQSWHLPRALHHEETDERENRRNRGERISAAKLNALCRVRLGDWIARWVRVGGKVTPRAVLTQRAAAVVCSAVAEFVRATMDEAGIDVSAPTTPQP